MKVEYKKIEDKFDRYNIYNEALTWDTKKTFQTDADEINILWLLNIFIGVYNTSFPLRIKKYAISGTWNIIKSSVTVK